MKKNSDFFERILCLSKKKGYRSINDFARNGLGYKASEKINRLKDETKKPSYEILFDISNKFEDVDMNWLITGRGEMLRPVVKTTGKSSPILTGDNTFSGPTTIGGHSINVTLPEQGYQKIINSDGKESTIEVASSLCLRTDSAELGLEIERLRKENNELKDQLIELLRLRIRKED